MLSQCCNAPIIETWNEFEVDDQAMEEDVFVCEKCYKRAPICSQGTLKSIEEPKTEESLEKICADFFDAYDSVRYTREVGVMNKCFIEVCERFLKELEDHKKLIQKHHGLVSIVDKFCNTPSPF